jgi:acylphosphatase
MCKRKFISRALTQILIILLLLTNISTVYCWGNLISQAGRFRRLVGTMTPPDDNSDRAEIYVEGKRNTVEGFIRWCQKADIGLSQTMNVLQVLEEEPTGLYDGFYIKTH